MHCFAFFGLFSSFSLSFHSFYSFICSLCDWNVCLFTLSIRSTRRVSADAYNNAIYLCHALVFNTSTEVPRKREREKEREERTRHTSCIATSNHTNWRVCVNSTPHKCTKCLMARRRKTNEKKRKEKCGRHLDQWMKFVETWESIVDSRHQLDM